MNPRTPPDPRDRNPRDEVPDEVRDAVRNEDRYPNYYEPFSGTMAAPLSRKARRVEERRAARAARGSGR